MDVNEEAIELHKKLKGKIKYSSKKPVTRDNLKLLYTPGVAEASLQINKDKKLVYDYTGKGNFVAVITDGSSVLGLGDIGPEAALPVMEGKSILLKEFGNVDSVPICLETQDVGEIIDIVKKISPGFGGINLEDISAPRCFEIEEKLQDIGIPVFHDDQHGTAIVVLAALINACKVIKKKIEEIKIVISGAGAAGIAVAKMLLNNYKIKKLIVCDSKGILSKKRNDLNEYKKDIAEKIDCEEGNLRDALVDADVFIGVSKAGIVDEKMINSMNKDPIVFAMANPNPEIDPGLAKNAGAAIIGTGRSDFPNQINNVLAFPGVFRGALDANATKINEEMKLAAATALAGSIEPEKEKIIPDPLDKTVVQKIAASVKKAAIKTDVVR